MGCSQCPPPAAGSCPDNDKVSPESFHCLELTLIFSLSWAILALMTSISCCRDWTVSGGGGPVSSWPAPLTSSPACSHTVRVESVDLSQLLTRWSPPLAMPPLLEVVIVALSSSVCSVYSLWWRESRCVRTVSSAVVLCLCQPPASSAC